MMESLGPWEIRALAILSLTLFVGIMWLRSRLR